jgi:hypothetical protein
VLVLEMNSIRLSLIQRRAPPRINMIKSLATMCLVG